jgi:HEAT repeat protein
MRTKRAACRLRRRTEQICMSEPLMPDASNLWACTDAIVVLTVVAAAAVMMRRLWRDYFAQRSKVQSGELAAMLLAGGESSGRSIATAAGMQTLVQILNLVRGSERDRVVRVARSMGAPAMIERRLQRAPVRLRILAAEALAAFPDESTLRVLDRARRDADVRVRVTGLRSYILIGGHIAIAELVKLWEDQGGNRQSSLAEVVRRAVAERPEEAVALLRELSASDRVSVVLIDALAAARIAEAALLVAGVARTSAAADIRAAAVQALGVWAHTASPDATELALRDADSAHEQGGRSGFPFPLMESNIDHPHEARHGARHTPLKRTAA